MDHFDTVRSPEQLAFDLATALQFSISDLRAFRKGVLPITSCQLLMGRVLRPLLISAGLTLLPLFAIAYFTSSSNHTSISDGLMILFSRVTQIHEFAETEGWFRTVLYGLGVLGLVGFGAYYATRIPLDLMADIMAKQVRTVEGRVTGREEEKNVKQKPDELPDYYFEMKQCTFTVNRRAFVALDSGGLYRVYYLPRSRTLVAIEPGLLAKEAEEKEQKLRDRTTVGDSV